MSGVLEAAQKLVAGPQAMGISEILARGQAHGNKTETQARVAKLHEHGGCLLLNSHQDLADAWLGRT